MNTAAPKEQKAFEPYLPFPKQRMQTQRESLEEMLTQCSRFRTPLSWSERLGFKLGLNREWFDPKGDTLVLADGIPSNWKALVEYLHAQGVTDSRRFSFSPLCNDVPKTFSVRLSPRVDIADTDGRAVDRHGFGSAASIDESMSRAIGELLERYCLSLYRRDDLYCATFERARAKHNVLDIFRLNNFLPSQIERFPAFARAADRYITCVKGVELLSGKHALIPASLVFWNYRFEKEEMILMQPTTNGGAGHFTREEAVLSALLELIQRDGFLIYWLNNLSPKIIDPSTFVDPDIKEFLNYLHRYQFEYHFLNTTTDVGVPSCACVLIDRAGDEPIISVGGVAGFSLKELILQSAREALSVHSLVSSRDRFVLPEPYVPFTDPMIGRKERLRLWRGNEMLEKFRFFISGKRQSFEGFVGEAAWYDTSRARLTYIAERLKNLGEGYELYAYEVQHPVLSKLGYHVVRTIVPRLMHLYLNEHIATLDAPRLRSVPEKLGLTPAKELNPWPHPFP